MNTKLKKTLEKATKVLLKEIKSKGYTPLTTKIASEYVPAYKFAKTGIFHNKFIVGFKNIVLMNGTPMINNIVTTERINDKEVEEIKTNWELVHIRLFSATHNKGGEYVPFIYNGLKINYQIIAIDPSNESDETAYIKRTIDNYVSSDTLNTFKDLYDFTKL